MCEGCLQTAPELKECRIIQGSPNSHSASGYWRDLCADCRRRIKALPELPREKPKADVAWDKVLASLRSGLSRSAPDLPSNRRGDAAQNGPTPLLHQREVIPPTAPKRAEKTGSKR
jgi:hypothetical protein